MDRLWIALVLTSVFLGCERGDGFGGFPPQQVIVKPLKKSPVVRSFSVTCKVFQGSVFRISFPVSGVISSLNQNTEVKKGEILAELESSDILSQIESVKKDLELQRSILERYKNLKEIGGVSAIEFQSQETLVQTLSERLVELDKFLRDRRIQAPAEGSLGPWLKKIGESVQPTEPIGSFRSEGKTYIDCSLPSGYRKIFNQDFRALLDSSELKFVSTSVDTDNNDMFTVRLTGEIDIPDGSLVEIRFQIREDIEGFVIPIEAIKFDFGGSKIFVVSERDGRFFATQRVVNITEILGDSVIIDAPLEEGVLVVTAGVPKLFEGASIEFNNVEG